MCQSQPHKLFCLLLIFVFAGKNNPSKATAEIDNYKPTPQIPFSLDNYLQTDYAPADGFDFAFGNPDGKGSYTDKATGKTYDGWDVATKFAEKYSLGIHPAEDWNGSGGQNTDLGQDVFAVANGRVAFADNCGRLWGKDEAWVREHYAEPFSDGLALIKQADLYGYIDHQGKVVIAPQFKYAEDFSNGLAPVSKSWNEEFFAYESYYYINKSGAQAIPEKFSVASPFFKGLAHVRLESSPSKNPHFRGNFAYINTTGTKVFTYTGDR